MEEIKPKEEDLISKLPDALISKVLSYLPTKEAVGTSVLSSRWKSLWLFFISDLDLDTCQFRGSSDTFVRFMEKFIDSSRVEKPRLHKVNLIVEDLFYDPPCITRWIDLVATPELEHLDLKCHNVLSGYSGVMPLSIYTCCPKLMHLRLHRVFVCTLESVSLPCLKTMRLENNTYADEACLELLISSCPVLEDFSFVRKLDCGEKVLRVGSETLTSLSIGTGAMIDYDAFVYMWTKAQLKKWFLC